VASISSDRASSLKVETALPAQEPLKTIGSVARRLEEQGFDALYTYEGSHDPFLPVAQAARETRRVELGTGVAIAFARNPMICAQTANDLQLVSEGRFILGLGAQTREHIERRFSQTWSKPAARMREFIQAIRAIWKCWSDGEPLDFQGEFYTHTLMVPLFDPGPNPFGNPKIFVGAVGPRMLEMVGEVCDGLFISPFNTREYVLTVTLPALEKGLATSGRARRDFEVSCQTIVMLGSTDEEVDAARTRGRGQLAFHLTLPAYQSVIGLHGWDPVVAQARHLHEQGRWSEVTELVSDEMLDTVGVSGSPVSVGRQLRERCDFADRIGLVIYNETDDEMLIDLVRAIHET
jgi:probable F420-dependent oxidoreductase